MATTISWHIQKHTSGQLVGLQNHNERKGKNHSNERIDPERSHLNYESDKGHLADFKGKSYKQRFQAIMDERANEKAQVRKTSIVDVQHTVQFGGEAFQEASQEQRNEMMAKATKFVVDRFGGFENVMSYNTHLDETNDHVHLDMVPLTDDGRLSARDLYSKGNLQTVQNKLLKFMQAEYPEFGFERASEADRGFANGKTQKDFEKLLAAKKDADAVILKAEEAQEELTDTAYLLDSVKENLIQSIVDTAPNETLTLEELEKQKEIFPDHGLTGELAEKPMPFGGEGETQIRALFRQPIQLVHLLKRVTKSVLHKADDLLIQTKNKLAELTESMHATRDTMLKNIKSADIEISEEDSQKLKAGLSIQTSENGTYQDINYIYRKAIKAVDKYIDDDLDLVTREKQVLINTIKDVYPIDEDIEKALLDGDPLYWSSDVDKKHPAYLNDVFRKAISKLTKEQLEKLQERNHHRGPRMWI